MSLTYEQAYDEIHERFLAAWEGDPLSQDIPVLYWDTKSQIPGTGDSDDNPDPWARITVQHSQGNQASLVNHLGRQRYEQTGVVTIQIFTPLGTGLSLNQKLSKIAADAFRGKKTPGGVWFRNVRPNEVGESGAWFQTNILAEFEYDEII